MRGARHDERALPDDQGFARARRVLGQLGKSGVERPARRRVERPVVDPFPHHAGQPVVAPAIEFEPVELAYLIDFRAYFAPELEALGPRVEQGLVTLSDSGIEVTASGWFFVRAIAMVFDRYLQADRNRAQFSKII